ncbi:MAG TPA: cytochrome c oxidase subunit II [Chloroflexota bacterium]|nr:cytochrome c oxidase subunit II [Chloroflexota bacterium]
MNGPLAGAWRRWPLLVLPLALLLGACDFNAPQSTLRPPFATDYAGDVSHAQGNLFWLTMLLAAIVFVLVEGALIYTIFRYRRRANQPLPHPTHGHTVFEVGWTIIPTLILVGLSIPSIELLFRLDEPPPEDGPALDVQVVGHQWWWEFRYPGQNVVTATELHIPVGQPVRVTLQSADVQHSFWVPRLAGKTDLVPPRVNHMWFNAKEPGRYYGQCAELCGIEHAQMRFYVVAQQPADFQAWVQSQQPPAATPPAGTAAERGANLIITGGCIACHTIQGTPAQGVIGPNLTHVASRSMIAGGILPFNAEDLSRWLHDPQEVKPGNHMILPRPLTDDEISDLVAYLQTLR